MKRRMAGMLVLVFVALAGTGRAQDGSNPSGTWNWTLQHGLMTRELSARLNQQGDRLTGVFVFPNQTQAAIEEGRFKDGEVFFKFTHREGAPTADHHALHRETER